MELSGSNIKNFINILKIEHFYISENGNPEKFFIFQETELFYISVNENLKKNSIFQEMGLSDLKKLKNRL